MADKKKIDVNKSIQVHMILGGPGTRGWVHTHGMREFGLPELEIRDVPTFLMCAAGILLNNVCDAMLNNGEVFKLGETMRVGREIPFRFKKLDPIKGDEEHYAHERWAIADVDESESNSFCGQKP